MKRVFIVAVLLAALGLLSWAGNGQSAPAVELKIATLGPDGSSLTNAIKAAAGEIQQKTAGRVVLKIYPGGVMGPDTTVLRKMRQGQIHGSTFTAGGIANEYEDYQVLSLPLLFKNYKQVDAVRARIEPTLTKGLEQKGFISMGMMEAGFVYMMSNTPITSLEALRGRKVWIPEGDPISERAFKELGVPPVPRPITDVLTGLQTGMLDTVSSSPVGALVLQWYTKVKYLSEAPLLYSYGTFAFSKQAWDKIPAADQPIVRDALTRYLKGVDRQNRIDNEKGLATLKNQGIKFVQITPDSQAKMQALANRTIDALVQEGQFTPSYVSAIRQIVQSIP